MSLVSTDPRLVNILKNLEKRKRVPHKEYMKEIMNLHRKIPSLSTSGRQLAEANVRVSTDRSRIVQIKVSCLAEMLELRGALDDLTLYLGEKYTSFLSQYRNKGSRDAVVANALAPLSRRIRPLKNVVDVADVVLADYDKKSFGVRDNCAALQLGDREV